MDTILLWTVLVAQAILILLVAFLIKLKTGKEEPLEEPVLKEKLHLISPPLPQKIEDSATLKKEDIGIISDSLEKCEDPGMKNLLIGYLFEKYPREKSAYDAFFDEIRAEAVRRIDRNDIKGVGALIEKLQTAIAIHAPRLSIEDIQEVNNKLHDVENSITRDVRTRLQTIVNEVNDENLLNIIRNVPDIFVDDKLRVQFGELYKNAVEKHSSRRKKQISSEIERNLSEIDEGNPQTLELLQDLDLRLLLFQQAEPEHFALIKELKRKVSIKREESLKASFIKSICDEFARIEPRLQKTGHFLNTEKLADDDYKEIEKTREALREFEGVYSSAGKNSGILEVLPFKFDANNEYRKLDLLEERRVSAYQKWGLNLMRDAYEKFNKESFFWQGIKDKTPLLDGRKAVGILRDILIDTLWVINLNYMNGSINNLYHQIETKMLEKVDEGDRISLLRDSLIVSKRELLDVPVT